MSVIDYLVPVGQTGVYVLSTTSNATTISSFVTSGPITFGSGIDERVYGNAISTTMNGGFQFVESGGASSNTILNIGGSQLVYAGGTAINTTIDNNEDLDAEYIAGGKSVDTIVYSGDEGVYEDGLSISTTVSGGYEGVNGSIASNTTVDSGGSIFVNGFTGNSHGIIISSIINSGGSEYVYSGGTANATVLNGGYEEVDSGGIESGTVINSGGTLSLLSGAIVSGPIIFGSGGGMLVLNDPSNFDEIVTGLSVGDQIALPNTGWSTEPDGVAYANLGTLNGSNMLLEIVLGNSVSGSYVPTIPDIPVQEINGNFVDQYFAVTQNGTNTILTLSSGNPIALAVNEPANGQYAIQGSNVSLSGVGITIGIISDGQDESLAMAAVVLDIAPGAKIDFEQGTANAGQLAAAITSLQNEGCNIIVDDVGGSNFQEPASGGIIDAAIDAAVDQGDVTYITAAGNDRGSTTIYGHSDDTNALTVASMNILSTPTSVGGYIPTQTESDSSIGATGSDKPDITGPDGGPALLDLYGGFNPFDGTSAAAPAVAAVAALMMQANQRLEHDPDEIYNLLEDTATAFVDHSVPSGSDSLQTEGYGLVNASAAVAAAADYVACYVFGTRIRTDCGEKPIDKLEVGNLVVNCVGDLKRIRWIGHRTINCTLHPDRQKVLPICVRVNAFGESQPRRDLYLSPDHAVFIDNHLIPIRELINGRTIHQIQSESVEYFHLELDVHDIILAENLPVETFLDAGNRGAFANADEPIHLHPNFVALSWETSCAPLLIHGPKLDAIKARLEARSNRLAAASTHAEATARRCKW